jgi:hypothetical protein
MAKLINVAYLETLSLHLMNAMKAYGGVEVQLHTLTSPLGGGVK